MRRRIAALVDADSTANSSASNCARPVYLAGTSVQALRHLWPSAGFHAGCCARPGDRVRSGRLRPRHGRATHPRPCLLERRAKQTANPAYQQLPKSVFEGYRQTRSDELRSAGHHPRTDRALQELKPGEEGEVILDHTPFYAESGGQVGDRGWLYSDDHNTVIAEVTGCYYPVQGVRAHRVS